MCRRGSFIPSACVLIFSAALLARCGSSANTAQAEPTGTAPASVDVRIVTASRGPIESALEISGTLTPRRHSSNRTSGHARVDQSLEKWHF